MADLTRHTMTSLLLAELRAAGLGARDLFEGRQEPLSWFFRVVTYDQSELDILESGAVNTLHAPSALVELVIDELALGLINIEVEGLITYLVRGQPDGPEENLERPGAGELTIDPAVMLGFLHIDVAAPQLWLEERESSPTLNESLANKLTSMMQELGSEADASEVHIQGALDEGGGWDELSDRVRPADVALHFSFDIPLVGAGERQLVDVFRRGAAVTARSLEGIRSVFRAATD